VNVVLPRLDRASAERTLARYRHEPLAVLSSRLPDLTTSVTYAATGGARVDEAALERLRSDIVHLAVDHGMPNSVREVSAFEGRAARLIRRALPMTPHEASQDEVWSYVTCCWLLDVALWRFGEEASDDRFIGHINRNTFRRMWWRDEVLGDAVDLTLLGEDELVNIMERPTLYADTRVARAIAREFLVRVERGDVQDRMRLMREATKRLLRLTPFLGSIALADSQVDLIVADAFDAASAGLAGRSAALPQRTSERHPNASPDVTDVAVLTPPEAVPMGSRSTGRRVMEFEEVARAAIDIARSTGRVTNTTLREAAAITSDEAREILRTLMERSELARRGVKRGTYYVIPEVRADQLDGQRETADLYEGLVEIPDDQRSEDSALRRLIRRAR
jgi:hypothetical protein